MRAARLCGVLLLLELATVSAAVAPPRDGTAAAATTVAAEVARRGPLRLSSHFCPPLTLPNATDETPRTCTFHDLYLWGGRAYYLSEGAALDLDSLGLDFELWRRVDAPRVSPSFFLTVLPPHRFSQLLAGGGRPAPAVQETVPLAYFWKARTVLPTPAAPCNSTSLLPGSANYYHFQAEWVPLLSMTLCEQFGHCDQHSQRSRLRIIDVHPGPCHQQERYPCWYAESMACLSDHPLRHIGGTTLRDRLVHVETAWMGVGPRCRGIVHGCYQPTSPRLPPTPPLVAHWRGQLARCLGFDGAATAPLRPLRLMVVDREFGNSRSMLNTNSLLRALRRAYPADEVEVELAYMESLTLAQQAALWSRASVVLHVHGATIANYWAAPRGAVTIQLTPVPRIWNPAGYTRAMERDLAGTTDLTVLDWVNSDPTRLHLPSGAAAALAAGRPDVAAFMAEGGPDWLSFAANFSCPDSLGAGRHRACVDLLREVNMEAPVGVVLGLVDTAIARVRAAHPRPPAAPAAAAAAPAAASGSPTKLGGVMTWRGSAAAPSTALHAVAAGAAACACCGLWAWARRLPGMRSQRCHSAMPCQRC